MSSVAAVKLTNSVSTRADARLRERRTTMRKRLKKKKRSCPLCKPHKTGGSNRWKAKDEARLKCDERDIRSLMANNWHGIDRF